MMRHYEITFLVHPDQSEQVPAMIDRYKEMVVSGKGSIHRVENWGRRRLAYMINNVHKAHYVMLNIECDLKVLSEIERNFKFNDSILRHLVIRQKGAITEESPIVKQKQLEDAKETDSRDTAERLALADNPDKIKSNKDYELAEPPLRKPSEYTMHDDDALDDDALDDVVLDEYALEEDALEDDAIKDAALKNGGIE